MNEVTSIPITMENDKEIDLTRKHENVVSSIPDQDLKVVKNTDKLILEHGGISKVNVFPNPLGESNILNVELEKGFSIDKLSLFTINGISLQVAKKIEGNNASINMDNHEAGLYFVRLIDQYSNVYLKKIIKQ